jgi:hypothetical protein
MSFRFSEVDFILRSISTPHHLYLVPPIISGCHFISFYHDVVHSSFSDLLDIYQPSQLTSSTSVATQPWVFKISTGVPLQSGSGYPWTPLRARATGGELAWVTSISEDELW